MEITLLWCEILLFDLKYPFNFKKYFKVTKSVQLLPGFLVARNFVIPSLTFGLIVWGSAAFPWCTDSLCIARVIWKPTGSARSHPASRHHQEKALKWREVFSSDANVNVANYSWGRTNKQGGCEGWNEGWWLKKPKWVCIYKNVDI